MCTIILGRQIFVTSALALLFALLLFGLDHGFARMVFDLVYGLIQVFFGLLDCNHFLWQLNNH